MAKNKTFTWHPHPKPGRYALSISVLIFSIVGWIAIRSTPELWTRIVVSIFALCAFFSLIEQNTRVDEARSLIIREGLLFGRFRLWLWCHRLSGFTGVVLRKRSDPEHGDNVFVGLKRRNGRYLWVSYFHAGSDQSSVEAMRVARSLADATELQLFEDAALKP